jgi:DNA invertase Pin-like site-specific DNA recombinase
MLKHRQGLAQLLSDVVGGPQLYRAILVYDVSRWGRFQDTDESAHYEFLCKTAGIPIHYCAETFVNDGAMPNMVMKTLKRVMAAEYSRKLSIKVFEGLKRLSQPGFRAGGPAGYGLRRMLCSKAPTLLARCNKTNAALLDHSAT